MTRERPRRSKSLRWMGTSREDLSGFPDQARQDLGYAIWLIQLGETPTISKAFTTVGLGAREICVEDKNRQFRVMYVAKFDDAVYVLHAFQKKTQKTSRRDIEIAKRLYREAQNDYKKGTHR